MDPVLLIIPLGLCGMCCLSLVAAAYYYYYYYYLAPVGKTPKPKSKKGKSKGKTSKTPAPTATPMPYVLPEGLLTDCAPNKRGVIGWEHPDRAGKSWMWCKDDDKMGFLHDKLSYLSIPRGMKATVYENTFKSGLVKTFDAGEWNLEEHKFENGHQLHNRASSIKIEGVPPDIGVDNGTYVAQVR